MEQLVRMQVEIKLRGSVFQPAKNADGTEITEEAQKVNVKKIFSEKIKESLNISDFQLKGVEIKII